MKAGEDCQKLGFPSEIKGLMPKRLFSMEVFISRFWATEAIPSNILERASFVFYTTT
jgi:hypothetical protein